MATRLSLQVSIDEHLCQDIGHRACAVPHATLHAVPVVKHRKNTGFAGALLVCNMWQQPAHAFEIVRSEGAGDILYLVLCQLSMCMS